MKVTMTNGEAMQKLSSLQELQQLSNPVPAVVGYRVVQNIHALSAALAPYREMQEMTVRKHANGGNMIDREKDPEAFEACARELHEIEGLGISVEIGTFPLSLIADSRFPMSAFFALDFMIDKEAGHGK